MGVIPFSFLRDIHRGEDIWVVAAGPSAGFVHAEFFDGKITIGVNRVFNHFPVRYTVLKENNYLREAETSGTIVIASRHHCGVLDYRLNEPQMGYVFDHKNNELRNVDYSVIGTDLIVVSFSTITSAIHVAAYMGAANIILVGHDCGFIDGMRNLPGYGESIQGDSNYDQWLGEIEPQTLELKEYLDLYYGCRIYSLNPWVNFGLESHKYERANGK